MLNDLDIKELVDDLAPSELITGYVAGHAGGQSINGH